MYLIIMNDDGCTVNDFEPPPVSLCNLQGLLTNALVDASEQLVVRLHRHIHRVFPFLLAPAPRFGDLDVSELLNRLIMEGHVVLNFDHAP